ncbi:MAG: Hpt domain-containing protein [Pseudomonadota bacterium]
MTQYIDETTLEVLQEVMEDEFPEVLQAFIVQAENDWPAAKIALDAADLEGLSRSAHSLKGSALSLGAGPLSELLETLEHEARAGNQDVCSGLHARAEDCMTATLAALRNWAS